MDHVCVVIPAFNAAATIATCLESVLIQDWPAPYDVVVVDDGSQDDTAQIAEGFDGVRVIRQPNAGPSAARNTGVRACTGSLIAFLDADDSVIQGGISTRLELLEPSIDLLMTIDTSQPPDANRPPSTLRRVAWHPGDVRSPSGWLLRRTSFESVGGFNERMRALEDVDFVLRVLASGGTAVIRDRQTFRYTRSGSGRPWQGNALMELASLSLAGESWASALSPADRRRLARRYLGFAMNVFAAQSSLGDVKRAQQVLREAGLARAPHLSGLEAHARVAYQRARRALR